MNMAHQSASTFAEIIRGHAAARPNAPALTFEDVTQTFAELDALSSRTANALRAEGIRPGDRVAVLTRNRAEFFELIIACSKIGAILVGLNWRLAATEIAAIITDAAPAIVMAGPQEQALLPETPIRTLLFGATYDAWRDAHPATDPGYRGAPDEVILLLYTSGTTGLPKGVMLTNEGMSYTRRLAEAWGMTSASVNLVAMPMFHIGGCGYGSSTMMAGGHTVLMREVDPARAVELIARHRVTHTFFVPAVVQMLLQVPGIENADLSSLELLMYGAAPIGDVLLKRALEKLNCGFMHAYGMTEASGTVTILPPVDHDPGGPRAGLLKSCGKPLPWVEMRVIDPATQAEADTGTIGEVWLRSPMIMKGYWNNQTATREAIVEDGWYRTGDAGYRDADGYLYLVDRFKDMIISGGENIYPAEIENALNAHPAVKEVGVIGIEHSRWGETPMAVVVLHQDGTATAEDIIEFTRGRLARYKCPTSVVFADALPRNASGKLLKHEMRRIYRRPGVTPLSLVRRWVNDYFNRHDAAACAAFVAPDYALEIGDVTLAGRDDVWLPAVDVQMKRFPGLGMTVHQTVAGGDWAAAFFSEHGASEGRQAVWSGVGIWRSNGEVLTGCIAQEDYMTRQRQLRSGVADPVEPPAVAPWDVIALPRDETVERIVAEWLQGSWPRETSAVRCDDDHITGTPLRFDTTETEIVFLNSSGPDVVFHVRQSGLYRGGLAKIGATDLPATLYVNGLVRVEDGRVVSGRVIRDRVGLQAALERGMR
jgi:acyl-CoA synthetase (AMP-forming)/AMP-acid ligase II